MSHIHTFGNKDAERGVYFCTNCGKEICSSKNLKYRCTLDAGHLGEHRNEWILQRDFENPHATWTSDVHTAVPKSSSWTPPESTTDIPMG